MPAVGRSVSASRAACDRRLVALGLEPLELVELLARGRRELSTFRMSIGVSSSGRYLLTPTMVWRPESMRAWVARRGLLDPRLGMPASIALAMPPSFSTSSMCSSARAARS